MSMNSSPYSPVPMGSMNGQGNGYNPSGFDTISRMVVDGNYIDGSWELSVLVDDLNEEVRVRVLGTLSLGGLMHRIVEAVNMQQSWSDHGVWWSDRNMWLLHNRTTLDQYGIQSDAKLVFRRMHGDIQLVLPSMIPVVLRVNYSSRIFTVVRTICKELNIRHPEELSLSFPITREHFKMNHPLPNLRHGARRTSYPTLSATQTDTATLSRHKNSGRGMMTTDYMTPNSPYGTLHSMGGTMRRHRSEDSLDCERLDVADYADCNQSRTTKMVFTNDWLMRPKNLTQKARLNSGWLDSSRSLLEHGIEPPRPTDPAGTTVPTLHLAFKYYAFYDINLKYDAVRIHLLYEQARWSILTGLLDCTEDEMVVFAAYQLQAQLQSNMNAKNLSDGSSPYQWSTMHTNHSPSLPGLSGVMTPAYSPSTIDGNGGVGGGIDEVDNLLAELEQTCGVTDQIGSASGTHYGSTSNTMMGTLRSTTRGYDIPDTADIPQLEDSLRVYKDRTFLVRRYKVYWVVICEARMLLYKSQRESEGSPLFRYSLRDCSITPEVSTTTNKYILKLSILTEPATPLGNAYVPSNVTDQSARREEILLRFEAAEQYARWLAACRLGARGKTLASRVAYEKEMDTILEILRLQVPRPSPVLSTVDSSRYLADLGDFCVERIVRKSRSKDYLRQRISEAHVNIRDLSALDAKYKYIQAWQRLTGFGRSYFTVLFDKDSNIGVNTSNGGLFSSPLDDLIAICQGRVEIISAYTGDVLRAWNMSDLKSWNVHWDAGKVILDFRSGQVTLRPLCTNCKTIVEFIGGYVFLGQRTPEKSQDCNEKLYHRLTGATD